MKYCTSFLLVCLYFSFTFLSCDVICKSKKVGSVNLLSETKAMELYTDGQKVTFTNELGKDVDFFAKVTREKPSLCRKVLCKGFSDPFKNAECEFFEGESYTVQLTDSGSTVILNYSLTTDLFEAESELFYDKLIMSANQNNEFVQSAFNLKPHFSKPKFDESKIVDVNRAILKQNVIFNGLTFNNIIESQQGVNRFYMSQTKGIVAVKLGNSIFIAK